ncbi:MAG: hypothetical protein ABL949_04145 [Fimbriimonadaceae bacterium]
MHLSQLVASKKLSLFAELKAGMEPTEGSFDSAMLQECRKKGSPQVGKVWFEPHSIHFEFIYPDSLTSAGVLTVTLATPERIVFLPVPEWVIETIWQGDVDGSYHFESDAMALVATYTQSLKPEGNAPWFGPRQAKRRE